jgi:nitrous oxidase accessory protein NosD
MRGAMLAISVLTIVMAFSLNNKLLLQDTGQAIEVKCDNTEGCFGLLEQAIASAPPGAVIHLSTGTFYEHSLTINKNLTIQGVNPEKTLIKGMRSQAQASGQPALYPVFHIESDSEIQVLLKALTIVTINEEIRFALFTKGKANVILDHSLILNGKGLTGIIVGNSSFVTIRDSVIVDGTEGIQVEDSAILVLSDSQLLRGGTGLEVQGAGVAWLQNCTISRYQFGIIIGGSARAYLDSCKIYDVHFVGLLAEGSSQFELSDSEISNSLLNGIVLSDLTKGKIIRSLITSNMIHGIAVADSAVAEIQSSVIADNGIARGCGQQDGDPENICNGVAGRARAQIVIDNSVIRNNTDWGVATFLKQCGYSEDDFTGKIVFLGENKIEGNNKSGNHSNMGNPGDHPFKNLPSGQVCTP